MKETEGLYYGPTEKTFHSRSAILKAKAMTGDLPELVTPLPKERDFHYWSARFRERQDQYKETRNDTDHIVIKFPDKSILNFIGDVHTGSPDSNYDRLEQEVETIVNTPNSYAVIVGDLVDGFFFNPAQFNEIEQTPEQYDYTYSLLKYLSSKKKLIAAWGGDHDQWAFKMGLDPYGQFAEKFGAYYMHGVGYITAQVGDNEYKLTGAHRMPGFSMYNNVHPQMRADRFGGAAGSDIIFSGHNHRKGHSEQAYKEFPGEARMVHYISLGPYKSTDDYAQKLGFAKLSPQEMYGCSVVLDRNTRQITYYNDILLANEGKSL